MTGRTEPSQEELRADLHKRMYLLDHGPRSRHTKRFNRQGVSKFDGVAAAALGGGSFASDTGDGGSAS